MRILHVLDSLGVGGAERYAVQLVNALSASGVHVELAFAHDGGLRGDVCAGVRTQRMVLARGGNRLVRYARNYMGVKRLRRMIRSSRLDIVHTHLPASGFWAWLAARSAGASVVYNPMAADSIRIPIRWLGPANGRIGTWLDSLVARYVVFSKYFYEEYVGRKGIAPGKVVLNPLPVDTARFTPGDRPGTQYLEKLGIGFRRPVLGMVARLYRSKGVDLGIRILHCLKSYHPEAMLVVVGEGTERLALEELAARLGVADSVRLLGNRPDVPEVLRAIDMYLMCTVKPNLGLAVVEALSAGRPVALVARNEAEREMAGDTVTNETNGVVISDDPERAASVLAPILNDCARLASWGDASRRLCEERFSLETHVRAMIRLYENLAGVNGV